MNDINQKLNDYIRARRRKLIGRIIIVVAIAIGVASGLMYFIDDDQIELDGDVIGTTVIPEIKGDVRYIKVRLSGGAETTVAVPDTLKGKSGHRVVLVKHQVAGSSKATYTVKDFRD